MREYSTPLTVELPATGNLTDDVVTNAAEHADAVVFSPARAATAGRDVTAARVPRRGARGRQGPGRRRRRGRRPGRPDLQDPLRVDAARLRDLVRRRGHGAVYETSSAEQIEWILERLRRRARSSPRRRARRTRRRAPRRPDRAAPRLVARRQRRRRAATGSAQDISDDELEAAAYDGRRRGDLATLIYTSGTTGRPKGCVLTHGNFMFELGVAVDRARRALRAPTTPRTLLFLPLAHVFARIIQVGCVKAARPAGPQRRHQEPARPTSASSSRRSSSPCRACSRRSSTPPRSGPTADGRGKIFDRAADDRDRLLARRSTAAGRRLAAPGPARAVRPAGLRQAARRARRPLPRTPSPAARRSATGSATSTAASALTVLEGYGLTETTAAADRQPARRAQDRHRRPAAPRHRGPGRRRRRAAVPGRPGLRRLLAATRTATAEVARRATAGSTPATSARSTTRASSGSPAARRRSW